MCSRRSGALCILLLAMAAACGQPGLPARHRASSAAGTPSADRLVLTYYFYWYDASTGAHLQPAVLRYHPPAAPSPSWRSVAWQAKQLSDMADAGIDGALAVYWGFDRPQDGWSPQGLDVMAQASALLERQRHPEPRIGMFFDTTVVAQRDLRTGAGRQWFYANFKDFFTRIPPADWLRVDGRPVAFLFTSDFTQAFDQGTFDYVYSRFAADFGVRPYIVREVSWDYPFSGWSGGQRLWDRGHPVATDDSYLWGAAMHGYVDRGGVATVGPGFDDHLLPGRGGTVVDRQNGTFYTNAFDAAIRSGKRLLAIETWNELHEGSNICETQEFGRRYLDMTRRYADAFHHGS